MVHAHGNAGDAASRREAARHKSGPQGGQFGVQQRAEADGVILGEPFGADLLDPPALDALDVADAFDDPWGDLPPARLDPWAEPVEPFIPVPETDTAPPVPTDAWAPEPETDTPPPIPTDAWAPEPEIDFPAVGEFSGLYGHKKRWDGTYEEPIEVTAYNRDLLANLTQDDIDNRTDAYYDAGEEERRRLMARVSAEDITLPENPTPEDVARVAAAIDDAFTQVYSPLDRTYTQSPLPVLAEVYGTPDRAVIAVGQAVADRADALATGYAEGGAESTTAWWRSRVEELEAAERRDFEAANPGRTFYASPALRELQSGADEKSREALLDHADSYKKALAEVREMGGAWDLHHESSKPGAKVVQSTADCWPTEWLETSNSGAFNPLHIGSSIRRAHYVNATHESFTKRGQGEKILKGRSKAIYEDTSGMGDRREIGDEINLEPRYDWEASNRRKDPGKVYMIFRPMTEAEKTERGWDPADAQYAVVGTEWVTMTDEDIERHVSWNARYNRTVDTAAMLKGFEKATDPNFNDGKPFWRKPQIRNNTTGAAEAVSQIKLSGSAPKGKVHPQRDPRYRAAVHELGHRMEYVVPNLNTMARTWRERRVHECEDEKGREVRAIYRGTREMGASDGFVNHYVGKSYDHRDGSNGKTAAGFVNPTEVFSMGAESVMAGSEGGLIGIGQGKKADPDMRAFILGCMATAGMASKGRKRETQGENPTPGLWGLLGI